MHSKAFSFLSAERNNASAQNFSAEPRRYLRMATSEYPICFLFGGNFCRRYFAAKNMMLGIPDYTRQAEPFYFCSQIELDKADAKERLSLPDRGSIFHNQSLFTISSMFSRTSGSLIWQVSLSFTIDGLSPL